MAEIEYPRDVVEKLHRRFNESWSRRTTGQQQSDGLSDIAEENRQLNATFCPLPSTEVLRVLLDTAYAASLVQEEGRPMTFTLGFLAPATADQLAGDVLRFSTPLSLEAASLAKIALATDPSRTTLGVWSSPAGILGVWGLLHRGDDTFAIDLKIEPRHLLIQVLRPGTFTVRFDQQLMMLFSRDHCQMFEPRPRLLETLRDRAHIDPRIAQDVRSLGTSNARSWPWRNHPGCGPERCGSRRPLQSVLQDRG